MSRRIGISLVLFVVAALAARSQDKFSPGQINWPTCTSLQYYAPYDNTCHTPGTGGTTLPNTTYILAGDGSGGAVATHMDDGHTNAGMITATEPLVENDGSGNGGTFQALAGTDPGGAVGMATYTTDPTNGYAIIHEGTAAGARACTGTNGVCASYGGGVPNTIPNLMFWFSADRNPQNNGTTLPRWYDPTTSTQAVASNHIGATYNTSAVNGQPAVNFNSSSANRYLVVNPPILQNSTVFVVLSPNAIGSNQMYISGPFNSYAVFLDSSGHFNTAVANVANVCVSTSTLSAGTWYQANCTWNYGGSWAVRVNETSAGSGTASGTINAVTDGFGYASGGSASDANSMIAEIIVYNRVLTSTEITTIETYLHGKYGI